MKITNSNIRFNSSHSGDNIDLILNSEIRNSVQKQRDSARQRPGNITDRVSISKRFYHKAQSEYSAGLVANATVRSPDREIQAEFHQKELVESLVGAAIDRKVVARELRKAGESQPQTTTEGSPATKAHSIESRVTLRRTQTHFETEQMSFSSRGQVTTQDGRAIDFNLEVALDRAYLSETQSDTLMHFWQDKVTLVDPLVINLEGGIPGLSSTRFEFDLDNDGKTEEIAFTAQGSGFLSFDRNNDGVINNGSELFGPGTGNGFEELAAHDGDGNGWIDENDDVFSKLSVWTKDAQGNDHLISLKDAGVGAVYLDSSQTGFNMATMDNELMGQVKRSGVFLFENGNIGLVQEIDLAAKASGSTVSEKAPVQPSDAELIEKYLPGGRFLTGGGEAPQFDSSSQELAMKKLKDGITSLREDAWSKMSSNTGQTLFQEGHSQPSAATLFSEYQFNQYARPEISGKAGRIQKSYDVAP
ncbi:MAG: hypothetical protein MI799_13480 [Desulfobacterales bacterium]|nr:hypothetical protein [Desulfobacterales bacterium]